ncbi:MAG: ECF-type sigma factor, partial [Planctomycetaceae bacterium]
MSGHGAEHGLDPTAGAVTRVLEEVRGGNREAVDRLLPLVYDELRRIA